MTANTPCPQCGDGRLACRDSRPHGDPDVLRRRARICDTCGARFTTHEMIVSDDAHGTRHIQLRAAQFLRDVELAAREHFGDEAGRFIFGKAAQSEKQGKR